MQIGTIKIKRKCKQANLSTSLQIVQAIIGCMYECAVVNSLGTGLRSGHTLSTLGTVKWEQGGR